MDDDTIQWILSDASIDPVSNVPDSAVVFMLYYGLELKHFLLNISNDIVKNFNPGIRDYKDTSLYLAGSAAQGFYLNTNDFLDARDVDIVSILRKEVRDECEFDKKQLHGDVRNNDDENGNRGQCSGTLKENSTTESPPSYLNIETWEDTYPGYVMLRKCRRDELPVQTTLSHRYVSSFETTKSRADYWNEIQTILADVFRSGLTEEWGSDVLVYEDVLTQGPAASSMFTNIFLDVQLNADLVFALPYPGWPDIAKEWLTRITAGGWPSSNVKQDILKSGCLIVPKGQTGSRVEEYEWRISFSFAELKLSRTLNRVQREIVHVLKAFLSDKNEHGYLGIEAKLDSYFVINLLYTESEKVNSEEWTEISIAKLVFHLLEKLESSIRNKHLPHYFIPANNLLHKFTFNSIKISKGEFKRGYGEDSEIMEVDEYIDFALYAVMRLRHDPLGQILTQKKYVQLTGPLRRAVFEPLVTRAKESMKVEGEIYFLTVLRLAKAHLFQFRFREAYLYTEDAVKFYKALGQSEITEKMRDELFVLKALTAYLAGNYGPAKELFEKIEREYPAKGLQVIEKHKDIYLMMYARTLFSLSLKYTAGDNSHITTQTERMFRNAVSLSREAYRSVLYFDLLNYFMHTGRYQEAEVVLNEMKCLREIVDHLESSDFSETDNEEEMSQEESQDMGENLDTSTRKHCFEIDIQTESCPADKTVCDKSSCDTNSALAESVELADMSDILIDEDKTETGGHDSEEVLHIRTPCRKDDKADLNKGDLLSEKEKHHALQVDITEKETKESPSRAILDLHENQDLLNQYALFQAFKKLRLNENADSVFQKLSKKLQERNKKDQTVTMEALDHDYMFYMSINVEEPAEEDWENPFTIFKDKVLISVADQYILDDVLKSIVERYGVVRLSVPDMYHHFRVQLLELQDRLPDARAMVKQIQDQDLLAAHYHSLGENEKAEEAEFYARLFRDGGGKTVAETLKLWIEKMMEAARKYEPRNVYLDSVFT